MVEIESYCIIVRAAHGSDHTTCIILCVGVHLSQIILCQLRFLVVGLESQRSSMIFAELNQL